MRERRLRSERLIRSPAAQAYRVLATDRRRRIELEVHDRKGLAVRCPVHLRLEPRPTYADADASFALSWSPVGHRRLLPTFSGTLEVTELALETIVTISGSYRPPLGLLGWIIDRAGVGRLAQTSVDSLLAELARMIDSRVRDATERAGVSPPLYPPDLREHHL